MKDDITITELREEHCLSGFFELQAQLAAQLPTEPLKFDVKNYQSISYLRTANEIIDYVATPNRSNKVLGCISLSYVYNFDSSVHAQISNFIVDEDYRNKGIGKKLLDFVIAEAKQSGRSLIKLKASTSLEGYYNKLGFKADSKDKELIMYKCLK